MKVLQRLLVVSLAVLLINCKNSADNKTATPNEENVLETTETSSPISPFVSEAQDAHNAKTFMDNTAITFDITIRFGGNEVLNGKATFSTDSSKGKIELGNGNVIMHDGQDVYVSPTTESTNRARFNAYTWSYFFLFPYKMDDQGTIWSDYTNTASTLQNYDVKRLNFADGTGDAPDDWYIVYTNKDTNLIEVAAYIVTAGKSVEDAESDPHAIKYEDFKTVSGVPIATKWSFWGWNTKDGLTDKIGEASLSNIAFTNSNTTLDIPVDYKKVD